METISKKDFVDIQFTGYANGQVFDSNIQEELTKIHPEAKAEKLIIAVGEGMLVPGFDTFLEGKEINKDYEVKIPAKDAFGERKRDLVKTIPLRVFHEQKLEPKPGMVLNMDYSLAKVTAVSGARVLTDFNNPLAGREITYKFKILKKITEEKNKAEALFIFYFKTVPQFEIKDKIVVKAPKQVEPLIKMMGSKFKELLGKDLAFEELKVEKPDTKQEVKPKQENK